MAEGRGFVSAVRAARCGLLAIALTFIAGNVLAQLTKIAQFDLPAQALESALRQIAATQDVHILYTPEDVRNLATNGIKGSFSIKEAIDKLIEGTGLMAVPSGPNALVIKPTVARPNNKPSGSGMQDLLRSTDKGTQARSEAPQSPAETKPQSLERIEVTGTHIRTAVPITPVIAIDRSEIERSGFQSVGDVLRALPQNSGGGQNVGNIGAQGSTNTRSVSLGSTANLRGLGSESTLALVNGHRLAYDGVTNASDVSVIPLAAVQKIEVLADGASAIYGSDAIAGVVNFILRRDFDGAETQVAYADSTGGGGTTRRVSQLAGKDWRTGNALLAYEYAQEDAIYCDQRFFCSAPRPRSLLPDATRNSLFLAANQDLTSGVTAFVQALYTNRTAFAKANSAGLTNSTDYDVAQYGAVGGINVKLFQTWNASVAANLSKSDDKSSLTYDAGTPAGTFNHWRNRLESLDFKADGPLAQLDGKTITAAVGAGSRNEKLDLESTNPVGTSRDRRVNYAFGELRLPLSVGARGLELSLAGRHEDYSDFGTSTNPKVGFLFSPFSDLKLNASWGTSFRAPALFQKYSPGQLLLFNLPDPTAASGTTRTLFRVGPNPDLGPEKSASWSLGAQLNPRWHKDFTATATYFRIDYRHRIGLPTGNPFSAFVDPSLAGFILRNPSSSLQAQLIAQAQLFVNATGVPYDPATVRAYFNGVFQNLSEQKVNGVDLVLTNRWTSPVGNSTAMLNATYLTIRQRILAGTPEQTISGTVFNPPRFRGRAGMSHEYSGWSASAFVNYLGAETDPFASPAQHIASWTTVDAYLGHRFAPNMIRGMQVGLYVRNLFDRAPPFVRSASTTVQGLNYDTANASALGRFIGITASKEW